MRSELGVSAEQSLATDGVAAAKQRLNGAVERILAGDPSAGIEAEQAQRDLKQVRSRCVDVRGFS